MPRSRESLLVVGDWVGVRQGQIDVVLPRRSKFSRKTPFTAVSEQVLVANVDVAFLVMGLDERDFSIRRLERYLTTAWEGGATPVIVLNKADLATDLEDAVRETESVAFGVPVHVATAVAAEGVDVLLPYLAGAKTGVLLGSSGVGKSTLINALLGDGRLQTGEVRSDGRGRYTTSHRELLVLPEGGVLIDTPGLRELQLLGDRRRPRQGVRRHRRAGDRVQVLGLRARHRAGLRHPRGARRRDTAGRPVGELPQAPARAGALERKLDPRLRSEERKKWVAFSKSQRQRMKVINKKR